MSTKKFLALPLVLLSSLLITACSESSENAQPQTHALAEHQQTPAEILALANEVQFCVVPDPAVPSSAFKATRGEANGDAGWWVNYQCKQTCDDWTQCTVPAVELDNEEVIYNARQPGQAKQALAFVTGGMGGHIAYTEDGDNTLILHEGGGAPVYYTIPAATFEKRTSLKTVMVRWEGGYTAASTGWNWGWFSRSEPGPSTVAELNKRVASIFAWAHENLSNDAMLGTIGCSIGTTATLGTVVWHGLDEIIDYQLLSGGTPMGDINAVCGRRTYDYGYCDRDGVTQCSADTDCQGEDNLCSIIAPITETHAFESVVNHVHATHPGQCRLSEVNESTQPYPPFDDSSFVLSGKDNDIDHRLDLVVNIRGDLDWSDPNNIQIGGDEHWGLGSDLLVYNHINAREKSYTALDGHHCGNNFRDEAIELVIAGIKADKNKP